MWELRGEVNDLGERNVVLEGLQSRLERWCSNHGIIVHALEETTRGGGVVGILVVGGVVTGGTVARRWRTAVHVDTVFSGSLVEMCGG